MKKFVVKLGRFFSGKCVSCGKDKVSWGYYSFGSKVCPYCDLCPAGSSKTYKEIDEEKTSK